MAILEVFEKRPPDFHADLEVAACHVEVNGKLLLLERGPNESEGKTWGVPAGKIELNEVPHHGAIRELLEETGISIQLNDLEEVGKLYIRKHVAYVCHLFRVSMNRLPTISLSDEHTDYKWVSAIEAETMPLIAGARDMLALYYRFLASKKVRP
jgi:8-oxo-dGTP pyrophosphatase MutT (NUDIX family)